MARLCKAVRDNGHLWAVWRVGKDVHAVPDHDLLPHKKSRRCWCRPRLENRFNDPIVTEDCPEGIVVVHMPLDGRE